MICENDVVGEMCRYHQHGSVNQGSIVMIFLAKMTILGHFLKRILIVCQGSLQLDGFSKAGDEFRDVML